MPGSDHLGNAGFEKLLREKLAWEGELIPLPSEGDDEEAARGEIDGVRLRIER